MPAEAGLVRDVLRLRWVPGDPTFLGRLPPPFGTNGLRFERATVDAGMDARPTKATREQFWREYLTNGDALERRVRRVFRIIPMRPAVSCAAAPFAGPAAPFMRAIGKRPADKNPRVCQSCFAFIAKHHGGAEVEATFMFADIRGSTSLAERMSAAAFHALLDRFYRTASAVVFDHDGAVDKFVGDEVVAMFFPFVSGSRHASQAVQAAEALLRATGHADARGPMGAGRGGRPHGARLGRRRRRRLAHGGRRPRRRGEHGGPARGGRERRRDPRRGGGRTAAGLDPTSRATGPSRSRARSLRPRSSASGCYRRGDSTDLDSR